MNIKLGHRITDHAELKQFGYLLSKNLLERTRPAHDPLPLGNPLGNNGSPEVATIAEATKPAGEPAGQKCFAHDQTI